MKIKTITILALCNMLLVRANAQLSPQLASYSGYINAKVYAVTKAADLGGAKQLEVARYFYRNDSLAKVWTAQNVAPRKIEQMYLQEDEGLQNLLSPGQFAMYMVKTANGYSALLHAVALQDTLKLQAPTVAALMQSYNHCLSLKPSKGFVQREWENEQLGKILPVAELKTFLVIKEKKTVNSQATEKWQQLVELHHEEGVDSATFKKEVIGFLEKRVLAKALLQGERTKERNDSLEKALYLQKPFMLRKLELLAGESIAKSQFADIIAKREMLKLRLEQVDSMVNRACHLERLKLDYWKKYPKGKYPVKEYENDGLKRILSSSELQVWLQYKYEDQAKIDAQKLLEKLIQNKEPFLGNQTGALAEFARYYKNLYVVKARN